MADLRDLVVEELSLPVDPRVAAFARHIAGLHADSSVAVLFYGSCLRQSQLDGLMLDFYLIVRDYRSAYAKRWLVTANRLVPPNVFHVEHDGLVAKYAVLSEQDFAHECGTRAWTVSTAARFAQPTRLVWTDRPDARERILDIVATAAPTLLGWTLPVADPDTPVIGIWKRAFSLTYAAEIRSEREDRSASIVDADPRRYAAFGKAALAAIADRGVPLRSRAEAQRWWRRMQSHGKRYSVARLAKGSLTFAGGADYIIWKINRHAGTDFELKPWQRRHPLLGAISLLPRLLKSGAVR